MHASDRLHVFRTLSGRTTTEIASMLGISRNHLYQVERRRRGPGLRLALAIERLTATWEHGPIRASEWDVEEAPAAEPKPEAA